MVDDRTDRPYRSNEPAARSAPAKASPSGNDPLAELARLIGQNDPFSEFGRDANRRVAPPQRPQDPNQAPPHDWDAHPAGTAPPALAPDSRVPMPQVGPNDYYDQAPVAPQQSFAQNFGRQTFGGAPLAGGDDLYRGTTEVPGYPPQPGGYEDDRYDPNNTQHAGDEQNFYDDEPPSRRRMGILVIAGVFALAVIGTAGAFGYRALFGTSSVSGPPPVIKADTAPSKIVPAAAQSGKQITDRVNDKGIGEKLVSREEQPVAVTPQDQPSGPAPMGSGIVGSEPKKVRTIAIRPDQPPTIDAAPPPAQTSPPRTVATPPARPAAAPPPPRVVNNSPPAAAADEAEPSAAPTPRQPVARTAPPAQQAQASANAPLSLSPDAAPARPAPARTPAAPARTAAVTPSQPAPAAATAGGAGGYAVQVSSQRSEAEAQAAFRSLQGKFPGQLGGKQAVIRKVELGDKGTYYRAIVPAGSSAEAAEMCNGMKAAGGSCIIQRN